MPLIPRSELATLRPLLGKVNRNAVGPHPPETLRLVSLEGVQIPGGLYDVRARVDRSESDYGHNYLPAPDGRYRRVEGSRGEPRFEAADFPDWLRPAPQ